MKVIALALLLAQAPVLDVDHGSLLTPDAGWVEVSGGVWLSTDKAVDIARKLKTNDIAIERLKADANGQILTWVLIGAGLGLAGGVTAGWYFFHK